MRNGRVADLFRIRDRFQRSVHLDRDFRDATALLGYVVTPHARSGFNRLLGGLAANSGQRAWRITGDYGSGKSSFALALAHLLSGADQRLPEQLRHIVDFRRVGGRPQLLPILVTGSRMPIAAAIVGALRQSLEAECGRGKPPRVLEKARSLEASSAKAPVSDDAVLALLQETSAYLADSEKASGILIILDELGKFLEFAAMYPDRQDVYFLQRLAEAAARSGGSPLFVVGLLHQGFNAYADHLSEQSQREWEKVAGRFEEMVFHQPLEQTAALVADALHIRVEALRGSVIRQARAEMEMTLNLGWYGSAAARKNLLELAPQLYPLHPTVLPVLSKLFHRFGQNERSLFSFLFSTEPFGLRTFAEGCSVAHGGFYRIHDLYDYARACFGHRLSVLSYRSHWNHIESVVESFPIDRALDVRILKTVGLLNLLDTPPLLASVPAIKLIVETKDGAIPTAIQRLQKTSHVLHYRGAAGGYCLWPHTSVNLDKAFREAERAVSATLRVASLIEATLEPRPLVARRHYIETGNLRYFRVRYAAVPDLPACLTETAGPSDGTILVALCETPQEREEALAFAGSAALAERREVLVAIPAPLSSLRGLVLEAQRWEWVAHNVPELGNDHYAAEEVSRQVAASRQALQERVHSFLGLGKTTGQTELTWFRQNRPVEIGDGRDLLVKLSKFCDGLFPKAPQVRNELLNRHELSSAAAAARMRLIERLLTTPTLPLLGMDPLKKPPEMSMYLSVLKHGGLHRETPDGFDVVEPVAGEDTLNLLPSLRCIQDVLSAQPDSRVRVPQVFEALSQAPFGVRAGFAPLLLAVFAAIHEQEMAFYSNDAFVRRMSGQDFMRLVKAPDLFEIQFCRVTGVRAILFARLSTLLNTGRSGDRAESMLDVVRTLCVFAAQLPTFTHKTRQLSPTVSAVRDTLAAAKEPSSLIFRDLPRACGFDPFPSDTTVNDRIVSDFVAALKAALEELKAVYPELLQRIKADVAGAFEYSGPFDRVRAQLADTTARVLAGLSEPRLKGLCLRLVDCQLADDEWLEALGSFVCSKPPTKWLDIDAQQFREELYRLAQQFKRVEATAFQVGDGSAMRIAVTLQDGSDMERVVRLNPEEEHQAHKLEGEIAALIGRGPRIGIAAATRAVWKALSRSEPAMAE